MFEGSSRHLNEWPIFPLQSLTNTGTIITYGIVQAGDEFSGGIPYIRTGDIVDGEICQSGLRHTAPEIAARFERSRVRSGEIVMGIRATVGTTALVPAALDGANLTQGTARISPGKHIDTLFLLNFLRSARAQRWIGRQVKGATFREITLAKLLELPVQVPPIALQREFANRAKEIEKITGAYRAHVVKLGVLLASLEHCAFRGELSATNKGAGAELALVS